MKIFLAGVLANLWDSFSPKNIGVTKAGDSEKVFCIRPCHLSNLWNNRNEQVV